MPSPNAVPKITMLPLDRICPHEEYDPKILLDVTNSLCVDGKLHDPLLVSLDHSVILDGTHRYWALTRLGCRSVAAALYDYSSDQVGIGCWYRCLDKPPDLSLPSFVRGEVVSRERGLRAVREREALISMVYGDSAFAAFTSDFDIFQSYRLLSFFEQGLQGRGYKVTYATESDALARLEDGEIGAILAPPPIRKEEVTQAGIEGRLFPLKSSRHIINCRPISIDLPLDWLVLDAAVVQERLDALLSKGCFNTLPPGSTVRGRRYEEQLYVFEKGK